jgi:DNA polymerase III epsilon subunit-like protein
MRLADTTIVAIDFETTGSVPEHPDEPWQVGMVRITNGVVEDTYQSLLRVGDRPFNAYAPGRHASLRAELAVAPTLSDLWPVLRPWWLGAPLVAHNAAVEKKVVRQAAPLHRPAGWIDTLKLARVAYPDLPSHTLTDLLDRFGLEKEVRRVCPDRASHDALYDAVGCGLLLFHLVAQDGWQDATVEALISAHPARYYRAVRDRSP